MCLNSTGSALSEEMSSHTAFRSALQPTQPLSQPPSRSDVPSSSSSVSHVDVSYFDPEGVQELKRTLSAQSGKAYKTLGMESQVSTGTDSTIALKQGEPFDFAGALRSTLQRYVVSSSHKASFVKRVDRQEEYQIKQRELGVVFRDLRVAGLGASASYAPTLGSMFNPMGIVESIQTARHPPVRDILSGFEGVIKPGERIRMCTV